MMKRTLGIFAALAVGAAMPSTSEASFAKRIGSRYGGTLSSNTSISTQQLTADPKSVLNGSTSTEYDPSVVGLRSVFAEDGFFLTSIFVGVTFDNGETEQLVSYGSFVESSEVSYVETGYLQVFYQNSERPMVSIAALAEDDGYTVVDTDGEINGDNTHTMLFNYIAEDRSTIARYRLYADDGSRGFAADSLVSMDDPSFVITDIAEANVGGSLSPNMIPLPAAFGPGLAGLAGVGLVKRLRRRVAA